MMKSEYETMEDKTGLLTYEAPELRELIAPLTIGNTWEGEASGDITEFADGPDYEENDTFSLD